jgi:hypothetical protein
MRTIVLGLATALNAEAALAHASLVPHDHPHAVSLLPDAAALVCAAVLVGAGFAALRRIRRG